MAALAGVRRRGGAVKPDRPAQAVLSLAAGRDQTRAALSRTRALGHGPAAPLRRDGRRDAVLDAGRQAGRKGGADRVAAAEAGAAAEARNKDLGIRRPAS